MICIFFLIFLWTDAAAQSGAPVLHAGKVRVAGQINIPDSLKKDSVWVFLYMPRPFTGGMKQYRALLDRNGRFVINIEPEMDQARVSINSSINLSHSATMFVKNGYESMVSLTYNGDGDFDKMKTKAEARKAGNNANAELSSVIMETGDDPKFNEKEHIQAHQKTDELIDSKAEPLKPLYDKPFSAFADSVFNRMELRRVLLNHYTFLSDKMKDIVFKDYQMYMFSMHMLDYEGSMRSNYRNNNDRKEPDSSVIKKPVRQDYVYLKRIGLNNPTYLQTFMFPYFMQELMENKDLKIPRIEDKPVEEWLAEVKAIMADLVGFNEGQFYDLLVGNAYGKQFEKGLQPLSAVQIENIKRYYKGADMEKVLLRRNEEVKETLAATSPLNINATPAVPNEELMAAIVAKYKGKPVVVDFWATWCQPCLMAMTQSRDLKMRLKGKGVVFVYITNTTSPQKLWEKHIEGIRGEQYYIAREQWDHVMDSIESDGVPTYLIYDKNGTMKQKSIGYPGNESMQKMIEELL